MTTQDPADSHDIDDYSQGIILGLQHIASLLLEYLDPATAAAQYDTLAALTEYINSGAITAEVHELAIPEGLPVLDSSDEFHHGVL